MDASSLAPIRYGRIILGVLALGLTVLAVVAGALGPVSEMHDAQMDGMLLLVLGLLALGEIPAYAIVRASMRARLQSEHEGQTPTEERVRSLAQAFLVTTLIPAAMLEGWGLFGGIIYLITGQWTALLAPIIAIIGIVLLLPSHDKFNRFVSDITGQHWP